MGPLATSVAVLLAGASTASGAVFSLKETYDSSNFFDKFDFFESKFTGDHLDQDPAKGYVNYKNRDVAFSSGLAKYQGDEVYIGVDSVNNWWPHDARPSVRLESKKDYHEGLVIARFTHLPQRACGAWPAFWTRTTDVAWPNGGEIDILENWNLDTQNHPTFHTGNATVVGGCSISSDITGQPLRSDCSHDWTNSGCNVIDTQGPWATADGGVFAMEWTKSAIRIFTWSHANAPKNIDTERPDSAAWGKPVTEIRHHGDDCDLSKQFAPQKLVLNIDFCGDAAGNRDLWGECAAATGQQDCSKYVRYNPEKFKDVYFKVKDIRYFEESKPEPTSSSTTTVSTSTSSSSSSSSSPSSSTTSRASSSSLTSAWSNSTSATISSSSSLATSSSTPILTGSSASSNTSAPVSTGASWNISTPAVTASQEWTTSTVYTTKTYTISSCPATVPNCPNKGHVVTETIPLYTTVCPVTPTATATPSSSANVPGKPETSTTKITKVYTITACATSVTNCPVGKVTTEVVTSTLCSGIPKSTATAPGQPQASSIKVEKPSTSVATASSSIKQLQSTGASTGVPSVATFTSSHVASTGNVPSNTQQPTGTQTQPPVTALASPGKSVSKAVALVAGMLVAALFL